jgi:hypothetical protein
LTCIDVFTEETIVADGRLILLSGIQQKLGIALNFNIDFFKEKVSSTYHPHSIAYYVKYFDSPLRKNLASDVPFGPSEVVQLGSSVKFMNSIAKAQGLVLRFEFCLLF